MPGYPPELVEDGREGRVVVRFVVGREGKPREVSIRSASHPAFEKAVLAVLPRWRFVPGRDAQGRAVDVTVVQPIAFRLE